MELELTDMDPVVEDGIFQPLPGFFTVEYSYDPHQLLTKTTYYIKIDFINKTITFKLKQHPNSQQLSDILGYINRSYSGNIKYVASHRPKFKDIEPKAYTIIEFKKITVKDFTMIDNIHFALYRSFELVCKYDNLDMIVGEENRRISEFDM